MGYDHHLLLSSFFSVIGNTQHISSNNYGRQLAICIRHPRKQEILLSYAIAIRTHIY